MIDTDPFEMLTILSPMASLEERLQGDDALLASILATTPARPATPVIRRRRTARNLWVLTGAAAVTLGIAAYAVFDQASPSDPTAVACYSDASLQPAHRIGLPSAADPLAACARLWKQGDLEGDGVPQLTACISTEGMIAVIPGDRDTCRELGLANWIGALTAEETGIMLLHDAVTTAFGTRCISEASAVSSAEELLTEHGFTDWAVVSHHNWTPDRPCTASAIDPTTKTLSVGSRRATPGELVATEGTT